MEGRILESSVESGDRDRETHKENLGAVRPYACDSLTTQTGRRDGLATAGDNTFALSPKQVI